MSYASGFIYELDGDEEQSDAFLITNMHVITGKDWHPFCAPQNPNTTSLMHIKLPGIDKIIERKLYEDKKPTWFEHPELKWQCDVVALPFYIVPDTKNRLYKPVTRLKINPEFNSVIEEGSLAQIIGYPKNISIGKAGFPVWKTGYIASAPNQDITIHDENGELPPAQLPAFFVDAQTREGMSGAPVFGRNPMTFTSGNSRFFGTSRFMGCYSARLKNDQIQDAALGICWREKVIREICETRQLADIY